MIPNISKLAAIWASALKNMQHDTEAEQQLLKAIQLIDAKQVSFYLPYQALASFLFRTKQSRRGAASYSAGRGDGSPM
ncbi:MAG: hypothetical protein WKF84_02560 [Pyrinomonadaceae bacterium]